MPNRNLYVSGNSGVVAIVNYNNRINARNYPLSYLDDVYFHTSLNYIQIKETIGPISVTLPLVAAETYDYTTSSSGCSGGIGCFISTACTEAMGLDDDCHELMTLRGFRDSYMMGKFETCNMVADYYFHAPKIVDAISTRDDKKEIYKEIFENYIKVAVQQIERGDNEEALSTYASLVDRCVEITGVSFA